MLYWMMYGGHDSIHDSINVLMLCWMFLFFIVINVWICYFNVVSLSCLLLLLYVMLGLCIMWCPREIFRKPGKTKCKVMKNIKGQVRNQVWGQVWEQVSDRVYNQVDNKVCYQVRNQVWSQVWEQVSIRVRNQVSSQVRNQVKQNVKL